MKVKIIKSTLNTYWYANKIGEIFEVQPYFNEFCPDFVYQIMSEHGRKNIHKDDVELVTEENPVKFDLKKDKWFIRTPTVEVYDAVVEWLSEQGLWLHAFMKPYEAVEKYGEDGCLSGDKDLLINGVIFCSGEWFDLRKDYKEIKLTFKTIIDKIEYPKVESVQETELKLLEQKAQELNDQIARLRDSL